MFGERFGAAEDVFAGLAPEPVEESDELYLLSGSGATVKLRHELLDVKLLREVDADGLERWEPVLKLASPLSGADAAAALDVLGVPPPAHPRDAYTFEEFLAAFVGPGGPVRAVRVAKRRVRYTLGDCRAEIAEVRAAGRTVRSLAVESEDASAVVAAVRGIGFDASVNTSYPRGLAALVDAGPQRRAVIDVGTNSVKFHVGERDPGATWRAVADRAELTRLGEDLDDRGEISAEPLERTVAAISGMVEEAGRLGAAPEIAAVGTAGLRIARNGDDVVAAIRERTGVTIEVIPVLARIAAMTSSRLRAIRNPAVPTAAIACTPWLLASSTMAAIAATVRFNGSAAITPWSPRPSPSRVSSARSTMARQLPSRSRSPTWNLTELVPTSMTAKRAGPASVRAARPRG